MTAPRVLVAGIGNIFRGDDAFGVELVTLLARRQWPAGVRIVDFGTRGFDLFSALCDDYDVVVLVDALSRREAAGTLYLIEPTIEASPESLSAALEMHSIDPVTVLAAAKAGGATFTRCLVLGCEPQDLGDDDRVPAGLSPPAQAALVEAARLVGTIIEETYRQPAAALDG